MKKKNKFGAKRTLYKGVSYPSKWEATVAAELDRIVALKLAIGWDRQFKIECVPHKEGGQPVKQCKVTHRVDFRITLNDGRHLLVEAKGKMTADYRTRAKWLEHWWLPDNPTYQYLVLFEKERWRQKLLNSLS